MKPLDWWDCCFWGLNPSRNISCMRNQHLQGLQRTQIFLHPSGSAFACPHSPHRVLSSLWKMSCKHKLPYTTTLMPVFIPLILTRLPLKAIRIFNRGLANSLRGRAIRNEHPPRESSTSSSAPPLPTVLRMNGALFTDKAQSWRPRMRAASSRDRNNICDWPKCPRQPLTD